MGGRRVPHAMMSMTSLKPQHGTKIYERFFTVVEGYIKAIRQVFLFFFFCFLFFLFSFFFFSFFCFLFFCFLFFVCCLFFPRKVMMRERSIIKAIIKNGKSKKKMKEKKEKKNPTTLLFFQFIFISIKNKHKPGNGRNGRV